MQHEKRPRIDVQNTLGGMTGNGKLPAMSGHPQETTPQDALPLGRGVKVIASHVSGLVALDKPAGVLSHPNAPGILKTALLAAEYDPEKERYTFTDAAGRTRHAWLLNRIDSPTSGVVMIATEADVAETVKGLFAAHVIDKTYHAVVKSGRLLPVKNVWRDMLSKSKGGSGSHVRATGGGSAAIEAITHYTWLRANRENPPLSLVKLEPKTGRTHQLRIQTAIRGHAILGDKTYGDFPLNKVLAARRPEYDRLFLHCSRTAFNFVWNNQFHDFVAESPLPEIFATVVDGEPKPAVGGLQIRLKPKR